MASGWDCQESQRAQSIFENEREERNVVSVQRRKKSTQVTLTDYAKM